MVNSFETIIIIIAIAVNTGIVLWFITHYKDNDFGGNPMLLNINYNKSRSKVNSNVAIAAAVTSYARILINKLN